MSWWWNPFRRCYGPSGYEPYENKEPVVDPIALAIDNCHKVSTALEKEIDLMWNRREEDVHALRQLRTAKKRMSKADKHKARRIMNGIRRTDKKIYMVEKRIDRVEGFIDRIQAQLSIKATEELAHSVIEASSELYGEEWEELAAQTVKKAEQQSESMAQVMQILAEIQSVQTEHVETATEFEEEVDLDDELDDEELMEMIDKECGLAEGEAADIADVEVEEQSMLVPPLPLPVHLRQRSTLPPQ